jgi:hypothetical protein
MISVILVLTILFISIYSYQVNREISKNIGNDLQQISKEVSNTTLPISGEINSILENTQKQENSELIYQEDEDFNFGLNDSVYFKPEEFSILDLPNNKKLLEIPIDNPYYEYVSLNNTKTHFPEDAVRYNGNLFILNSNNELESLGSKVLQLDYFEYQNRVYYAYLFTENFDTLSFKISDSDFNIKTTITFPDEVAFLEDFRKIENGVFEIFYLEDSGSEDIIDFNLVEKTGKLDLNKYLQGDRDYFTKLD